MCACRACETVRDLEFSQVNAIADGDVRSLPG
jgi:hypothetical protein